MHAVVAFVLVCVAGWLLLSALGRARTATAGRTGTAGKRGGQRSVRQEAKLAWQKVRATDWLEQRRHERKNGAPDAQVATARPGRRRLRLPRPRRSPRQSYEELRAAHRERRRQEDGELSPPPARQSRPVPPPQPPPTAPPPPGRTTAMPANASGNAVEHLVEGVNQIHATAQAGGVHAKLAALKACHEGAVRFAQMAAMLARQMSEPGMNYGPEITEPVAKFGTHQQAAAMAASEADAALTSLVNMTVGDLAASSRQAPHHTELSENGSR